MGFLAALGTVATVAAAGVSAASAAGAFTPNSPKSPQALYGSVPNAPAYHQVTVPPYDANLGVQDYQSTLPGLIGLSTAVNRANINERNLVSPNASNVLNQGGADILSEEQGRVPKDVQDQTNRIAAERSGGAVNPSLVGVGGNMGSTDFARSIGQTSMGLTQAGLGMAPTWESLVDSFTYKPQQALTDATNLMKTHMDYNLNRAGIQLQNNENRYSADATRNTLAASPNPAAVGAKNDALIQQAYGGLTGASTVGGVDVGKLLTSLQGLTSAAEQLKPNPANASNYNVGRPTISGSDGSGTISPTFPTNY